MHAQFGNEPGSSQRTANTFNHRVISSPLTIVSENRHVPISIYLSVVSFARQLGCFGIFQS